MSFITDKQTTDDLNVLGKYKSHSIYGIFNQVSTAGGEKLLDELFHHPLTDHIQINARSKQFQFFKGKDIKFPFDNAQIVEMENYLSLQGAGSLISTGLQTFKKKFLAYIGLPQEHDLMKAGLSATLLVLKDLKTFLDQIQQIDYKNPYQQQIKTLDQLFLNRHVITLLEINVQTVSVLSLARYNHILKQELGSILKTATKIIYQFDVATTVSSVAEQRGLNYANALPNANNTIKIKDLSHPAIEKATPNSVNISENSNVLFLTGANMAGKSTLMKSFGVALYLAHMGFPVAASEMEFSVKDGMYTSINVPDSLSMGHSHFYAEVLRVKKIALEVSNSKNLVVIFDELFKGTNVKDAFDATLAVTGAFAQNRNCAFVISTHIIEVGIALKTNFNNLQFVYLPTVMNGITPIYTYKLQSGITADRHGMRIIENEKILALLK